MSARPWEIMRAIQDAINASSGVAFDGEDGTRYEVVATDYDHDAVTVKVREHYGYESDSRSFTLRMERS